jgi:integrase
MRKEFPYLSKQGDGRYFVRRFGRRIRLREPYGSIEFHAEYSDAIAALNQASLQPPEKSGARHGSFEWLARKYMASAEFMQLPPDSQRTRQLIIESCLAEPWKPDDSRSFAIVLAKQLTAGHIIVLRDRKGPDAPGAANNRLKYLSSMFTWAVQRNLMHFNPCRDVKKLKRKSEAGFHAWTLDEYRQFEARHPRGTKAYLALALLFFCGIRRGDLVSLGPSNIRGNTIAFVPNKTRHKSSEQIYIPFPKELSAIIEESPVGKTAFVETEYGQPFSPAGFGGWFRERCDEAGLPQCSAHGVRKLAATVQADGGATDRQLMAFFGWSTASMASVYVRSANQRRLAAEAGKMLDLPQPIATDSKSRCGSITSRIRGRSGGTRTPNPRFWRPVL